MRRSVQVCEQRQLAAGVAGRQSAHTQLMAARLVPKLGAVDVETEWRRVAGGVGPIEVAVGQAETSLAQEEGGGTAIATAELAESANANVSICAALHLEAGPHQGDGVDARCRCLHGGAQVQAHPQRPEGEQAFAALWVMQHRVVEAQLRAQPAQAQL